MSVATHYPGPNPARNHSFRTYDSTLDFLIERPESQAASLTLVEHISRRLKSNTSSTRLDDIVYERSLYTMEDGGRPWSRAHRHNSVRAMVCLSCQFCPSTVCLLGQPSGRITLLLGLRSQLNPHKRQAGQEGRALQIHTMCNVF